MKNSLQIEPQVYQELVDLYGQLFAMPPLSAKIYAYLTFEFERTGLCFDELVQTFCASKSSISPISRIFNP